MIESKSSSKSKSKPIDNIVRLDFDDDLDFDRIFSKLFQLGV